jgi:prepilin-type N-terminal cleavage/methylation domain-containing protein
MNSHRTIVNQEQTKSSDGFTLIELIVGIAMTLIISGLALQALVNSQRGFSDDRTNIENGQKLSSVLDIISRDVRQAGEDINETQVPVIQVIDDSAKGAKIVVYRALAEPLSLCAPVNPGSATNIVTSVSSIPANTAFLNTNPGCKTDNPIINPLSPHLPSQCENYPIKQQAWCDKRNNGTLYGILHSGGNIQSFTYTAESTDYVTAQPANTSNSIVLTTAAFSATQTFPVNSTAYIVEKRMYLICDNQLKVRINSDEVNCPTVPPTNDPNYQTIATNIERMDITTSIRTPVVSPPPNTTPPDVVSVLPINNDFPAPGQTWQNIQGLTVKLQARDPEGRSFSSLSASEQARLVVEGKFYPRNILSAKRGVLGCYEKS